MQHYRIELIEEYERVNFYSIHLSDSELSEFDSFFEKFPVGCGFDDDIDVIIAWLDRIAEKGALERYFRPEGEYVSRLLCTIIDGYKPLHRFKN